MIPPLDLVQLNRQLEEWCTHIVEVEPTVADPAHRLQLRQALEQIRRGQAMVNSEYQKEIDSIAQRTAAVERQRAEILTQLETLKTPPAVPAPVPPAAAPVDRKRGFTLRDELLARYTATPPSVDTGDRVDEGSVSKHWTEPEASESSERVSDSSEFPRPGIDLRRTPKRPEGWEDFSQSEE